MSEFSERMAKKLRERAESDKLRDAKFVETQRMKREIGPPLWAAVRSDLLVEVQALNREMGKEVVVLEVTPSSEISLRADLNGERRLFRAQFNPELGRLTWASKNGSTETHEVYVEAGQRPAFYGGTVPYTTGTIARQMLEILLD